MSLCHFPYYFFNSYVKNHSTFFLSVDAAPSDDINPTSGALYFVSNEARRQIIISILPDDIPEGKEVCLSISLSLSNQMHNVYCGFLTT